jgi:rSAM/selenodomain-associated transferase 1
MDVVHRILDPACGRHPALAERYSCALAIMTKAPRAGQVKTRLVPPLTPEQAAELNKCFLRDTAAAISACCHQRPLDDARGVAVYTPVGAEAIYDDILPPDFFLIPQRGKSFGDRLYFAIEDLFACGFESVCLIDSDSPTVPASAYAQAVESLRLAGDCVVLGPSDDGGYYLIGLKQRHQVLFDRIDWSTERVLKQTMQRAAELNLEVMLLPTGSDVDDRASLDRLRDELSGSNSNSSVAPRTRKFLLMLK